MGDTLNGATGLDIDGEVRLAEEKLRQLQALDSSDAEITMAMKDFGLTRYYHCIYIYYLLMCIHFIIIITVNIP